MYTAIIRDGMTVINTAAIDLRNISEQGGKFVVNLIVCGKRYFLGSYDTLEQAITVRTEARKHRTNGTFFEYYDNTFSPKSNDKSRT